MTTATPTMRRVTPTGRLVLPASAERDAWLQARRNGIGSSDIAAILGVSTFGNELKVYYDKRGELPLESDDSEPAYWGRVDEEGVARRWAASNRTYGRRVGLIANVDRPWQMCTLDRRIVECPINEGDSCALEIKCRHQMKAPQWRKGCPDDVLAQVLWQIDVCGFDHNHVAVKIGSCDYRQFTVWRKDYEQLILDLRAAGEALWRRVRAGRPPQITAGMDGELLVDLYQRMHPDREGVVRIDRDDDAQDALSDYLDACATESAAKKAKAHAKARMLVALGNAEMAVMGDRPAYSIEQRSKESTDLSRLRERWPDAYRDCVEDKGHDQLSIPNYVRKEHAR